VSPVEPLTDPNVAVIVALPFARPCKVPVLLIVATAGFDELHTTDAETSCVLLSLKVPVATNCLVVPTAIVELAGVTVMDCRVALVTVKDAVPLTEPDVAVIVVVPVPTLVANPFASTVATEVKDDDQDTDGRTWKLPSSNVPVATNCSPVPSPADGVDGLTEIETS